MKAPRVELVVLGVCVAIAVFAFWPRAERAKSPEERPAPALAAFPAGAELVVSIDFERLRQTELGPLIASSERELTGSGSLSELCGFDPMQRIRELALALPAARPGYEPELGLVATGDFEGARIVDCAARVVARRGGDPVKSVLDSFTLVRDRRGGSGEIAARDGGPVVLGDGRYLREMIDAAEGKTPSLLGDEAHSALQRALGPRGAAMASFVAPPDWLERFVDPELRQRSALASVRAGAVRLDLSPDWALELLLACPDAAECKKLGDWLERLFADLRQGAARELGSDPLARVEVTTETHAARARLLLDRARTLRLFQRLVLEAPDDTPRPAPSFQPDERIPAPREGPIQRPDR